MDNKQDDKDELITIDASLPPGKEAEKVIRELELSFAREEAEIKLIMAKKNLDSKEAEKWLHNWYAIKDDREKATKWKGEIGDLEEFIRIIRKAERTGERRAKEKIKKLKPTVYPTFEPVEKNLIDIALWYPTHKGLTEQKPEMKTWTIEKENLKIEYDYQLSLPTYFTFEVASVLQGIWKSQNYPDTFLTSLGEICRHKGIPNDHNNRDIVLIAIRQLHNTRISTPFYEKDEKGRIVKETVCKINIINIECEEIKAGSNHTLELRFNKYIANNIQRKYYTLVNLDLLNKLKSATAKRLYPIIKQYSNPYQLRLSKLKSLLNLRGANAKQNIERASQELVDIGFLDRYEIERGKRTNGYVYRAFQSKKQKSFERVVESELKGSRK
jgi:hypothetical protein